MTTDSFYIEQVLKGDTAAFSTIVDRHKDMVFTVALRIVRNREDAEELAQDAFIKAFQSLKSFKKEAKFSTWLYRIVYNAAISKTRKKKMETTDIGEHIISNFTADEMSHQHSIDLEEKKLRVKKAMASLNETDSTLITLYYLQGESVEEISEIINLSRSNVKVKLHRIRNKIYNQIQNDLNNELKKVYQ
jgi:RNA polymerase sigma-70 factor (ECF subfamily)